jgi:hypothetical protein
MWNVGEKREQAIYRGNAGCASEGGESNRVGQNLAMTGSLEPADRLRISDIKLETGNFQSQHNSKLTHAAHWCDSCRSSLPRRTSRLVATCDQNRAD